MDTRRLYAILIRFRARFLAAFPALTAQDLHTILAGHSETLLEVLQARCGYTRAEAKAAWNDFVLTQIDGTDAAGHPGIRDRRRAASGSHRPAPLLIVGERPEPCLWRLLLSDWGRLAPQRDSPPGILGRPVRRLQ